MFHANTFLFIYWSISQRYIKPISIIIYHPYMVVYLSVPYTNNKSGNFTCLYHTPIINQGTSKKCIIIIIKSWTYQRGNQNTVNQRRTDKYNDQKKEKRTNEQTMIYKTLQRKLKIDQHELHIKQRMNPKSVSSSCSINVTIVTKKW